MSKAAYLVAGVKYRRLMKEAADLIALAVVYNEDGAPVSGARCLREAADKWEAAQTVRNKAMDGPSAADLKKLAAAGVLPHELAKL